jgi:hypothetical protein
MITHRGFTVTRDEDLKDRTREVVINRKLYEADTFSELLDFIAWMSNACNQLAGDYNAHENAGLIHKIQIELK